MNFDLARVRAEFPLLAREVNGQPLAYLDSAASAQKPQAVIDAESCFYQHGYAAVHRGIHTLSAEATTSMETFAFRPPHSECSQRGRDRVCQRDNGSD